MLCFRYGSEIYGIADDYLLTGSIGISPVTITNRRSGRSVELDFSSAGGFNGNGRTIAAALLSDGSVGADGTGGNHNGILRIC